MSTPDREYWTLYDPPQGWMYGFPKPYTPGKDLRLQLIEDGYPPELIDDVVLRHCRFIGRETENDKS